MLRIVSLSELYSESLDVRFEICALQNYTNRYTFSCLDTGKPNCMLLFLFGCDGEYTFRNGERAVAKKGTVVYAPTGAEYVFRPINIESTHEASVIVNFHLRDENGESVILSRDVLFIDDLDSSRTRELFFALYEAEKCGRMSRSGIKSHFYGILSELSGHYHRKNILSRRFRVISPGIIYLEETENPTLSVSELARLCNVSEIYFRKLFKEYSGVSPADFKLSKRLERAKKYLALEGKSVAETASLLGFDSAAYFCRIFKAKTGLAPGEYRDSLRGRR